MIELIAIALISFLTTFVLTPLIAREMVKHGIKGIDLHKRDNREIPEMGGIAIVVGILLGVIIAYSKYSDERLLVVALLVILTGLLGIIDYFKTLSPKEKVISLSSIGLLLIPFCETTLFGRDFGILYTLLVPIFFMIACNFTNMLAGFNGLEIGVGAIASLGVFTVSFLAKEKISSIVALALFASLLAFLYYNKYPAKVFPGDVGTLPIGATLFSAIIFGKLELYGLVIFIPYAIDAALKYFSVGVMTRQQQKPTIIKNGLLYLPENSNLSLPRIFIKRKPMREKDVILRVWLIEAFFCLIAIFLFFFKK